MTLFIHETKRNFKSWLIWTLAVGGISLACIFMYSGLQDSMKDMADTFANMGSFSAAIGMDKMDLSTLVGYYATEIGIIFSLGGAMFAALIGSAIVSKEESLHTSEFLNTMPAGRGRILFQKYAALIFGIITFNIVCVAMFLLGFAIMGESLCAKEFAIYHLTQVLMQVEIGTICFMISAAVKKNLMGAGLGLAVVFYLADMMCRIVPSIENLKYIIPFYYSNAADIFSEGKADTVMIIIGAVITAGCLIASYFIYTKRDLAS